jgi:hypothetical protein
MNQIIEEKIQDISFYIYFVLVLILFSSNRAGFLDVSKFSFGILHIDKTHVQENYKFRIRDFQQLML